MSDTPKTDAERQYQEKQSGKPAISVGFARDIERELAAMTKERDMLQAYCGAQPFRSDFRTADELRAAYDAMGARVAKLREALEMIIRVNSNTESENKEDGLPDIHDCAETALKETRGEQ